MLPVMRCQLLANCFASELYLNLRLLLQVDFAQPLDYVEPVREPPKPEEAPATGVVRQLAN